MSAQFQTRLLEEINQLRNQILSPSTTLAQATRLAQQIRLLRNVLGQPLPVNPDLETRLQHFIYQLEGMALTQESRAKLLETCTQIKIHRDLLNVNNGPADGSSPNLTPSTTNFAQQFLGGLL